MRSHKNSGRIVTFAARRSRHLILVGGESYKVLSLGAGLESYKEHVTGELLHPILVRTWAVIGEEAVDSAGQITF